MANTIQIKRKTTTGAPTIGNLAVGEMVFVIPDDTLYIKKDAGTLISWDAAGGGTGDALTTNPLSQFAATTLAQLNGVLSDATLVDNNTAVIANTAKPSGATITAEIAAAISALVGGAPGALDTLNELANAMSDDASFSATVTASLAAKLDSSSTIDGGTI